MRITSAEILFLSYVHLHNHLLWSPPSLQISGTNSAADLKSEAYDAIGSNSASGFSSGTASGTASVAVKSTPSPVILLPFSSSSSQPYSSRPKRRGEKLQDEQKNTHEAGIEEDQLRHSAVRTWRVWWTKEQSTESNEDWGRPGEATSEKSPMLRW